MAEPLINFVLIRFKRLSNITIRVYYSKEFFFKLLRLAAIFEIKFMGIFINIIDNGRSEKTSFYI